MREPMEGVPMSHAFQAPFHGVGGYIHILGIQFSQSQGGKLQISRIATRCKNVFSSLMALAASCNRVQEPPTLKKGSKIELKNQRKVDSSAKIQV